jgi:hypothetical protein
MDEVCVIDETQVSDGEVVWSRRLDAGVKSAMMLRITPAMVTTKPDHQGARRTPLKPIAQGIARIVWLTCGDDTRMLILFCMRGCGCADVPGIPCVLCFEGQDSAIARAPLALRGRETLSPSFGGLSTRYIVLPWNDCCLIPLIAAIRTSFSVKWGLHRTRGGIGSLNRPTCPRWLFKGV